MVLRLRRRRTGSGPTWTALALLGLVLAVAYIYYETPLIQAGAGSRGIPPHPPDVAWTTDLPEEWTRRAAGGQDDVALSLGGGHILVTRSSRGGVDAVWYDRFGFAAARAALPEWTGPVRNLGSHLVAVSVEEPVGLRFLYPGSLPAGLAWTPDLPAAGMEPVAALADGRPLAAVAVFGAPVGPDLTPDRLVVLDLDGGEAAIAWSASYADPRLLNAVGGPTGLAALAVDPAGGRFRIDVWSWEGDLRWRSPGGAEVLVPVGLEGPAGSGGAEDPEDVRVFALDGSTLTVLGPRIDSRPSWDLGTPPGACWPAAGAVACFLRDDPGSGASELAFVTMDGRRARHPVPPAAGVWPWPGHGALIAGGIDGGTQLTAFDFTGARWTLDLPLAVGALAAGADGIAVSDGRRLAWLRWPEGGRH